MIEGYLGVPFRQITHRLRIQRGPGRADKVSERPRAADRQYLDSDEAPTLVTFDEYDQVDVSALLQMGAIVPWAPEGPEAPEEPEEVVDDVREDE